MTAPAEIALFVGVPADEAGFRRAWARGSHYCHEAYDGIGLEAGWARYAMAARIVRALGEECRGLGATVVFDASLEDVAAGARRFPVVVLLNHMSFPLVRDEDVRDRAALLRRLARGAELEWEILRSVVPRDVRVPALVDAINRQLRETHERLAAAPIDDIRDADHLARQRWSEFGLVRFDRPRIDELCGEAVLAPGRGIELSGVMLSARQLVSAFPPEYGGFVDLRMCSSISAGAALRRARPGIRVAVSKRAVDPPTALVIFKTTLAVLARRGRCGLRRASTLEYEEAMRQVLHAAEVVR